MPKSSAADTQLVTSQLANKCSNECFFPSCRRERCQKNGKTCMFCSRGCTMLWRAMLARVAPPIDTTFRDTALCMNRNCHLPRYKDPVSAMCYSYCSRRCALTDVNNKDVPRLISLDENNIEYARVSSKFQLTMTVPVASMDIYKIQMSKTLQERYNDFDEQTGSDGQMLEYFHGTTFNDRIEHSSSSSCGTSSCKVCGILRYGFLLAHAVSGRKFWLARQSAISHGYAGNSNIKSMFLCNVIKTASIQKNADIITVDEEPVSTYRNHIHCSI
ncbi:hypothetical protein BDF22DRAFT_693691 [Syncephalis plumigaleata]|nr:hypothetical protein BDF22DRAFT_693691 [Syncephalis plumigaleata]